MVGDREIAEPAQRLQGCAVAPAGAQFEGAEHRSSHPQAVSAHVDARASVCTEHAGEVCGELLEGGGWVPGEAFDSPVVQSLYPALCAASALPDEPRDL
jgi:hypothetical protein